MTALPWNSPGPFTCHCDICDAPPEPACVVCKADCIPLNDANECKECAPREDESCADWLDRTKARRAK